MANQLKFVSHLPPTIGRRVETNFEIFGSTPGYCTNCLCETETTCAHFCGSYVCGPDCAAELQANGHDAPCKAAARGIIPIVPRVFPLQLPKRATQEERLQRVIDLVYSGQFAGNRWTAYALADGGASAHVISKTECMGSDRWKNGVHWALFCVLVSAIGERFVEDTDIDVGVLALGSFQESYMLSLQSSNKYISEEKGALMHQRLHLRHRAGVTSVSLKLDGICITKPIGSIWNILEKTKCFFDRDSLLDVPPDPVQVLANNVKQFPTEREIRFIVEGVNVNHFRKSRVQVVGLRTNMNYNGSFGTIIGTPKANGRVLVKLNSGEDILVKTDNTKLLFRGSKGMAFVREALSMRHELYASVHCMTNTSPEDSKCCFFTPFFRDVVSAIACTEAWDAPVSAKIAQRGQSMQALMRGVQKLLNAIYCYKESKVDLFSSVEAVYMQTILSQWRLGRKLREFDGSHLWMVLNMPPTGLRNVRVGTSLFGGEGLVAERAMQKGEVATFHPIDYLCMDEARGVMRSQRAVSVRRDPKSWNSISDRHKLTIEPNWLEGLFGKGITAIADPDLRDRADLLGHLAQTPFKNQDILLAYQAGRTKRPNVGINIIAGLWPALVCLQDVHEGEELRLYFGQNFNWDTVKDEIDPGPEPSPPLKPHSREHLENEVVSIMKAEEARRNAAEADVERQNAQAKLEKEARKKGGEWVPIRDLQTAPPAGQPAPRLDTGNVQSNRRRRRLAQRQKEQKRKHERQSNIRQKESDEWIRKCVKPSIEHAPRDSELNDALREHGLPECKSKSIQKHRAVSLCEKTRLNGSPYEDEVARDFMEAMQHHDVQGRISMAIDLLLISGFLGADSSITESTQIPPSANMIIREELERDLGLILEACAGYARLRFLTKQRLRQAIYRSQKAAASE